MYTRLRVKMSHQMHAVCILHVVPGNKDFFVFILFHCSFTFVEIIHLSFILGSGHMNFVQCSLSADATS